MKFSRRKFLFSCVLAISLAWTAKFSWRKLISPPSPKNDPSADLEPSDIGTLNSTEMDALWGFFRNLGQIWKMNYVAHDAFVNFVQLKTNQPPSYFKVYRSAISCFLELRRTFSEEEAAKRILMDSGTDSQTVQIRLYVVREFIRLHLASGGFQQFGIKNVPGHPGGPRGYRLSTYRVKGI